jgi:uncharacterized membrane protein
MTRSEQRTSLLILLAILLGGLLVRLPGISDSFYGDEQFSLLRDSKELITSTEDRFRPVFFTLLYLWRQIGFSGEVGLRLLPLLFGLLQIPVAFRIGDLLGGRRLATAFGVLIAAAPMLIEFSQELRMYSLVALIAMLQVWALLVLLEKQTWWRWGVFVLVALAGIYTHLHYWLFLGGVCLSLLRERKTLPLGRSIAAMAVVVLLYVPNIPNLQTFVAVRSNEYSAVHLPSAIPKLVAAVTVGFNYFALAQSAAGRPVGLADLSRNMLLVLLAALPAALLFWSYLRLPWHEKTSRSLALCYELFAVPVLLALIATVVMKQYWLQPKYIIFVAPWALLFIALAYLAVPHTLLRRGAAALGAGVLLVALLHYWNPQAYGRRENWRAACAMLRTATGPRTALVLLPEGYPLLKYYWPKAGTRMQLISVPPQSAPDSALLQTVRDSLAGKESVIYLRWDVVQNGADPHDVLLKTLDRIGTRTETTQFNPRLIAYRWRLPS